MKYYKNTITNEVFGYDPLTQQSLIDHAIASGYSDITANWPPPAAPVPLKTQAANALPETDMVCIRCYKAGVPFPATWNTYTTALRNIANGTDTTSTALPTKPAYPAGT